MTKTVAHNAMRTSSGKEARLTSRARGLRGMWLALATAGALALNGCGESPAPKPAAEAAKPVEPEVPATIQAAAEALLGSESKVLVFGDLAKTGKQQLLVANVVPKTPKESITGTIVTRAVIAENDDGMWKEIFRCDEHMKNNKGYSGMTPIEPVAGWRL